MRVLSLALVSVLVSIPPVLEPCVAQAAPDVNASLLRGRLRGQVLDLAGTPWVGAKVIFTTVGIAGFAGFGEADRIVVRSDEKGSFTAKLLHCRTYNVWAMQDVGDGYYRSSQLIDQLSAGQKLLLREEGLLAPVHVQLNGLDPVMGLCELHCDITGNPKLVHVQKLDKDGEYLVPPMPPGAMRYKVSNKIDAYLAYRNVRVVAVPKGKEAAAKESAKSPVVLQLKAGGSQLLLELRSKSDSKPLVGARIFSQRDGKLTALGTTDAQGRVLLPVPKPSRMSSGGSRVNLNFLLMADGHATTIVIRSINLKAAPKSEKGLEKSLEKRPVDLRFSLAAGYSVKGRLYLAEGKPAASMQLALYTVLLRETGRLYHYRWPLLFRTDTEGRFEITGLSRRFVFRLLAVPSAAQRMALPHAKSYPLAPLVWLAGGRHEANGDLDLGELRLDEFVQLDLQIRSFAGAPAQSPHLLIGEATADRSGSRALYYPAPLRADRRGRVRLLVRHGESLALAAAWNGGQVIKTVKAERDAPQDAALAFHVALRMDLGPTVALSGKVVDADGKPVADFTVNVSRRGLPGPRANITDRLPRSWQTLTAEDGTFRITVCAEGQVNVFGRKTISAQSFLHVVSQRFVLDGKDLTGVELHAQEAKTFGGAGQTIIRLGVGGAGFRFQPAAEPAKKKDKAKKAEKKK